MKILPFWDESRVCVAAKNLGYFKLYRETWLRKPCRTTQEVEIQRKRLHPKPNSQNLMLSVVKCGKKPG
jgi:hypothetical protein